MCSENLSWNSSSIGSRRCCHYYGLDYDRLGLALLIALVCNLSEGKVVVLEWLWGPHDGKYPSG